MTEKTTVYVSEKAVNTNKNIYHTDRGCHRLDNCHERKKPESVLETWEICEYCSGKEIEKGPKYSPCPVCGIEKKGIAAHIANEH